METADIQESWAGGWEGQGGRAVEDDPQEGTGDGDHPEEDSQRAGPREGEGS